MGSLLNPGLTFADLVARFPAEKHRQSITVTADGELRVSDGLSWRRVIDGSTPKLVIFDPDWFTDCDDVGALRVLLWAHKKGLIILLAIIPSNTSTVTAQAISALMKADGVSGIPIASGPLTSFTTGSNNYSATMAAFAKTVDSNTWLPDAVRLYRTVLAAAPRKVYLCITGFLNNLSELLNSAPDSISPLNGVDLVRQKVERGIGAAFDFTGATAEFNTATTAPARAATANVLAKCPVPLVFNDFNTGLFPAFSNLTVVPTTSDIVAAAYNANGRSVGRRVWDLITAMLTVAPSFSRAGFAETQGRVLFDSTTGLSTFQTERGGPHSMVTPTVNFRALQIAIDSLLTPTLQPTGWVDVVNPNYATGVLIAGVTDSANLVAWYHPSDAGVADTAAVPRLPDRCGRFPLVQSSGPAQPTFAASKFGKPALIFAGTQALSCAGFALPHECTIYLRTGIDGAPGGSVSMLTNNQDTVASGNLRCASFVLTSGRVPQMSVTSETTYFVDVAAAFATGSWFNLTGMMNALSCEMLVDNVGSGGATALTQGSNYVAGNLTLGALTSTGASNGFTGATGELRIYQGFHTAAQRAAVIAEMAA